MKRKMHSRMNITWKKILTMMAAIALSISACDGAPVKITPVATSTRSISGTVSGAPASGVPISLTGDAVKSTVTDSTGAYVISDVANGSYTVTPTLTGYFLTPASLAVVVAGGDIANADFTAEPTYELSGNVSGAVSQGVTITLTGQANAITTTDAGGNYKFAGLRSGSYIVTPSSGGNTFVSQSRRVTIYSLNLSNINFGALTSSGPLFSISGTVSGVVQQGVPVILTGANCGAVTTDAGGYYLFDGLTAGTYLVRTAQPCTTASPLISNVTITTANVTDVNISLATRICTGVGVVPGITLSTISGTVSGAVQQGVTMILTGKSCSTTTTDANGMYTFSDYFTNGTYTVIPSMAGHTFSPASTPVTFLYSDVINIDFTSW
jgi:hypothetical protein